MGYEKTFTAATRQMKVSHLLTCSGPAGVLTKHVPALFSGPVLLPFLEVGR